MIGFLRFVGVVNAAVWFGAGVFFTFAGGPAVFSDDMKALLGPNNFPYFSGAIAQILIARVFMLQWICGCVAVAHLLIECLYLGRPLRGFTTWLLLVLLSLSLAGDFWMQPKIKALHLARYTSAATQSRETATRSFRIWHGLAQGVNLIALAGLVIYLWRVANPSDATRFVPGVGMRNARSKPRPEALSERA